MLDSSRNNVKKCNKIKIVAFKLLISICSILILYVSAILFSHVGMALPGLNQYRAGDSVSLLRTQHSDYLFFTFIIFDIIGLHLTA